MNATTDTQAAATRDTATLRERSAAFLDYLDELTTSLPALSLAELIAGAGGAEKVGVIAVDVVNGFCVEGPLASARVGAIVTPIARLLRAAHKAGVRHVAVLRDSHSQDAPEFAQFGQHCLAGTAESGLVQELAELPFAGDFKDIPKNATSAWAGTETLRDWVERREAAGVRTFVVVGDCTDLCVYQTAMPLKLGANARDRRIDVVVPADCVDTYDLPVETARQIGATPHDGALLHAVFLYHLALNGVRVVRSITA
jgi:nicotinamidase-related amidase